MVACPTHAFPAPYVLDARRCISYLTIEHRGEVPVELRSGLGDWMFGCDVCQEVCPWNRQAPVSQEQAFEPRHFAPPLEDLARLTEGEFRAMFHGRPIQRAKYAGFLRNVAVAMGNSGLARLRAPLERLSRHSDPLIAEHAQWALQRLPPHDV